MIAAQTGEAVIVRITSNCGDAIFVAVAKFARERVINRPQQAPAPSDVSMHALRTAGPGVRGTCALNGR
jgi:hypothetical protein